MNTVFSYLHVYIGDHLLSRSPSPLSPLLLSVGDDLYFPNQRILHMSLVTYSCLRGRGLKELGSFEPREGVINYELH